MENIVGFNNNLLIKWKLLQNDGNPFPVDGYACKLYVSSGRGRSEVKSFSVSGLDKNIVSWEMNIPEMRFLGSCSLFMSIYRKGRQVASVERRDAFRVITGNVRNCDCVQKLEISSFVNILHPEDIAGAINVIFPTFEIDETDMHLHMKGTTEQFNSNFELDDDGHLKFKNN